MFLVRAKHLLLSFIVVVRHLHLASWHFIYVCIFLIGRILLNLRFVSGLICPDLIGPLVPDDHDKATNLCRPAVA